MKTADFFIATLREAPADAEIVSQQLMIRAGFIKKIAAGLYTWMPLGLKALRKVQAIIREEMDRAGALELLMPAVQPAELWQKSGRWEKYGAELLRLKDRHQRDFVFGPTHEEVITEIARQEIKSYKQLPRNFYQMQIKFRDEIRPRFGVMRAREFIMKDAYSFSADYAGLEAEYRNMYATYSRIFTRLGLKFRAVQADTGSIGGNRSHEFHVLAESGEDAIAFCENSDYAANVELAESVLQPARPESKENRQKVFTPNTRTCADVAAFLKMPIEKVLKTVIVVTENDGKKAFFMFLLRADHSLNECKAAKIVGEFRFAEDEELVEVLGAAPGFLGPVDLPSSVKVFVDRAASGMVDFICGANETDQHFVGVNFGKDFPEPEIVDLRNVEEGDPSPDGAGTLKIVRGIEVGHIFQLRQTYAAKIGAQFLDENGKTQTMEMGCYGIGVTRVLAAAIEQHFDEKGIALPRAIAPFEIVIVPMNYFKSDAVKNAADALYQNLKEAGFDVLLDNRDERAGVLLADMELIGIPARIVVGERSLKNGQVEFQLRQSATAELLSLNEVPQILREKLQ